MDVKLLHRNEIDDIRWDSIVANSPNGTIYGYTFYLDGVSKNWMALVADNYDFILPIPFFRKFGITFIQNPLFLQRVSIYSTKSVSSSIVNLFLDELSKVASFIQLSIEIPIDFKSTSFRKRVRSNFVLSLDANYTDIYNHYSKDAKKSLRLNESITVEPFHDLETIIEDYILSFSHFKAWERTQFNGLNNALRNALDKNMIKSYQVLLNGERLASGIFFIANSTAFYVLGSPTPSGKKKNAIHFLIDEFIKEHALHLKALDFEGSDLPNVAYFYKKWGSQNSPYYELINGNHFVFNQILRLRSHVLSKLRGKRQ